MGETYIDQMNRILIEKRATGTGGVRLFVPEGGDFSLEDVAHDFCKVEEARANGELKVEKVASLPFWLDMSKTIHDVIRMARSLTDSPSALVVRDTLIRQTPGLDLVEEGVLRDLGQKYPEPFKLTSVDGAVLQPTLKKLGLSYLNFAAIPQECKLRGSFYGYVDNFLSPPTIYYRGELRPCWKRFTIAKELLHLFSGTSIDKGVSEASILIMAAKSSRRLLVSETTELDDETFAFYLAIEVMIPWQLRYQFDLLRSMNATTLQMAKVFMVPERIVQHFLSDSADCHCNYAGLSRRINENIWDRLIAIKAELKQTAANAGFMKVEPQQPTKGGLS